MMAKYPSKRAVEEQVLAIQRESAVSSPDTVCLTTKLSTLEREEEKANSAKCVSKRVIWVSANHKGSRTFSDKKKVAPEQLVLRLLMLSLATESSLVMFYIVWVFAFHSDHPQLS